MSKDVKIAGASYEGVPAISLPLADGSGNAKFYDVSATTAAAGDVANGKTFYAADGTLTTGTSTSASGGAGVWDNLVAGSATDVTDDSTVKVYGLTAVTSLNLAACTELASEAFRGAERLKTAIMPKLVTIEKSAFYNCTALTQVDAPLVTSIGTNAFYYCDALTNISLPSVKSIGYTAFGFCRSLPPCELPAVVKIDDYAFQNDIKLTSINIGPNITTIASKAFQNSGLKTINIERTADAVSGAPWGATNATVNWTGTK